MRRHRAETGKGKKEELWRNVWVSHLPPPPTHQQEILLSHCPRVTCSSRSVLFRWRHCYITSVPHSPTTLFSVQDIGVSEEPSADQTDLSASPPPPYVPPPPFSLSDITTHDPQDRLVQSDVTESLSNPVDEEEDQERGAGFQFDDKEEEEDGEFREESMEHSVQKLGSQGLEKEQHDAYQGMMGKKDCSHFKDFNCLLKRC